ncbi:hypothetical protein K490DRAFT_65837 [Saccharata proteae CBS 121410]|uniref:BTB domain-containing protein n=1 Tax=Saccharata proteae CBS 121410 TaxID=1314787 RepID=A0A9P4LVG1_9PEZI|nr:hypothetical protein K490DRAFT_65837 [Saccharata proteae CBS 121410]
MAESAENTPSVETLESLLAGFRVGPMTIEFDSFGDVELLLWSTESDPDNSSEDRRFIVSSKAMSFCCDAWHRMLRPDGGFKESQPCKERRKIRLPDDDVDALEILLRIAHLQFDLVPQTPDFCLLVKVAILVEKYDAAKLVSPWKNAWIKPFENRVDENGFEQWLTIAYAFGFKDEFQRVANRLVREAHWSPLRKCLSSGTFAIDTSEPDSYMPSDIIDRVLTAQRQTITRLLKVAYDTVDLFKNSQPLDCPVHSVCKQQNDRFNCDSSMLGSLTIGLQQIGLLPNRKDASEITLSVSNLAGLLKILRILSPHDSRPSICATPSRPCNVIGPIQKEVQDILNTIPSAVSESDLRHMERQQTKYPRG